MFSRISFVTLALALPMLCSAFPAGGKGGSGPSNTCNSGTVNCCNQVQTASPQITDFLNGLLGLDVAAGVPIGISCTPISLLVALGTNSCNQQTVCCTGNTVGGGLVTASCTPLNVVL
ncbi:hydrophobin-3 [Crucibulum laeve]|uniref:Hydrophobin n=1 Tax=Crucibulum laeve TaxID=68775 RepID=A0A5C3LP55_9AGAR|nr:hydrophobin-3 [Crucibulum laeve]